MKKIFLILTIFILTQTCAYSDSLIFTNYLSRDYVGLEYQDAITRNKPFLLVFVSSKDIKSILKSLKIGQYIYKHYNSYFNFSILNTENSENAQLAKSYNAKEFPALFLVDPEKNSYIRIPKKYQTHNNLKRILDNYLETKNNS